MTAQSGTAPIRSVPTHPAPDAQTVRPGDPGVLLDCAGGSAGGARRLLEQLDGWLARRDSEDDGRTALRVVGRGRSLNAAWLVRRERPGSRGRAVALNNVSFVTTGSERWVLLRNALHFLTTTERSELGRALPALIRPQAGVVHTAARRADRVVVPTRGMADRVRRVLPELGDRLVVRPHPLAAPPARGSRQRTGTFLCPIVFSRWKRLGPILREVDVAAGLVARDLGMPVNVVVTATEAEAVRLDLPRSSRLRYVGRLSPDRTTDMQASCAGILYPTRVESFGYPLAEARLLRVPVVAGDLPQNLEVAGDCLVPYQRPEAEELAGAMTAALGLRPADSTENPFDPDSYFQWLLRP